MIKKKKMALFISMTLVLTCSLSNLCYASVQSKEKIVTTGSSVTIQMNDNLSSNDLSEIKENINGVLSAKYEIMKDGNSNSSDYILPDSKLSQLIDSTNDFEKEWYKKVDLKISDYNPTVKIDQIKNVSENTYEAEVTYDVEFTLSGSDSKSSSSGEKYKFEIKNEDGNWYISKMLNLEEDLYSSNDNLNSIKLLKGHNDFENYDKTINQKIEYIDNITKNIDKYLNEYKESNSINQLTANKAVRAASYSGYDAEAAVDYAKLWGNGRNSDYPDYGDEDCTNFVSQCAYAGGIPGSSYWYSGSASWINVIKFYKYMNDNGYTSGGNSSSGARNGDIIQFYNSNKGTWSHSAILTGYNNGWLYSAHSTNKVNYPLSAVYPSSTYTNLRYIKFWH
ncbi:hypothetical protein BJV38_004882 [Clostridium beijerinckii]|uniref:amidase domain-containing protein n=1 Tax=Clostridium beijerinckii TaxID=1520 RepID=UPI00156FB669|nr:amidase domain-containing protein [Clostridium beijerinckii]NRT32534.1 hypothetical protein [Clostridium beijerinckii]NRT48039.1 hypothetical protein [Clostridium beijerinckii]NRZ23664.1 hypothetical protein [Clostridium beijerinckii]